MMITPSEEELNKLTYFELLVEKNRIVSYIKHFEDDITMKDPDWCGNPSPDVQYQVYLDYLGILAPILSRKFNEEYEFGTKNISDYYKDMKRNKKENFKNCQPKLY